MMLFIYDCVNTAFFVVLAYVFLDIFFKQRPMKNVKLNLIILVWMIIEIIVAYLLESIFIAKAICTIIISIIASTLIFEERMSKKIILSFLEYCLFLSFDLLAYLIAIKVSSYVYIFEVDTTMMSIFCGSASELLFLLAVLAIRLIFKKRNNEKIPTLEYIKFSVFPALTLSLIIAIGYYSYGRILAEQEIRFYTYLAIIFLVSNIYMYWLLRIDMENKLLKEKGQLFETYAHDLTNLYEQIREEHREIAGIEHEYKNHMAVISSLAFSGKTEELREYLNEQKDSRVPADVIDTGNGIVSAIFNAKYAEAIRKNIRVRFDISNLRDVFLSDTDLVIILSNLFNNAIEACEKCDSDRVIDIKITNSNSMLFISFSNSCENDVSNYIANRKTTKENARRHGFGLNNIRRIVEAYGGQMDIVSHNKAFIIRIMIFSAADLK